MAPHRKSFEEKAVRVVETDMNFMLHRIDATPFSREEYLSCLTELLSFNE